MATLRLIVGLGNPGSQYQGSRHNAGFWFVDALAASKQGRWCTEAKLHGEALKLGEADKALWLLKPSTFMNRSGQSVSAALRFFKIEPEQMLVAHDDLDLSPGTARLKFDGGHGGQNGLRDIQAQLGHGRYHRLRLGIGHPGDRGLVTPWVLGRPSKDDEISILRSIDDALAVMPQVIAGDVNAAMKQLHTRRE